ncbi:MAG: Holliday junction resolvase RuvX [Pseudomonadota bacterium]
MTCYLAIDLGKLRVGLASADDVERVVTPLEVLDGRDRRVLIDRLAVLAAERDAEFVVGLPLSLEGEEQRVSKNARAFARTLARATGRPVHLQDETLSSFEALELARGAGRSSREPIDDLAAGVLLRDFLASR